MKKLFMIALLTLTLGYGSTYAAMTCQQELRAYKSLYKTQLGVTNTMVSIIKDTNSYLACLRGVELGYSDFDACDKNYRFYVASWNILYKNGYVPYKHGE